MYTYADFGVVEEKDTLSNGVPITLLRKKDMPISIDVMFSSGSIYDPKNLNGLAHFTEHLLGAGTEDLPNPYKIGEYIESFGASYSMGTAPDYISIELDISLKEDLPKATYFIDQLISRSLFDQKSIENEREVIYKEIDDKLSSPTAWLNDATRFNIFQGTFLERNNLGTKETVGNITRKDLQEYYKNMISSGRASIAVAGDVDIAEVKEAFESVSFRKSEKTKFGEEIEYKRDKPIYVEQFVGKEQVHFDLSFPACTSYEYEELANLAAISSIIGNGRTASLYKKLRYDKGLVYSVGAGISAGSVYGNWGVRTSASKENMQKVLDIIIDELRRVYEGGLKEEELSRVKNRILKSSIRYKQTSGSWVNSISYEQMLGIEEGFPNYLNVVESLSIDKVNEIGHKYIKPGNWYITLCGDIKESDFKVNF